MLSVVVLSGRESEFMGRLGWCSACCTVSYNQLLSFRTLGSNCGLASKGLQLFLPLDPQKMIVLFDPVAYRVGPDHRNVVEVSSPQDVYALNTLQACAATDNNFRGDAVDTAALHRKAAPFLRDGKTRFHVFQRPSTDLERREEIIASSRADARTNLSLSFLTLRKCQAVA